MRSKPLLLLAGLALAACGVNGAPQPPKPDQFPHQYPAPEPIPKPETAPATSSTSQPATQ